ncbi:PREDICTED: uncharacterized protein LOC109155581 [Ipomoea nil]|uniref:uncharacterized protein LOC109155581 n=1 Tax=Ipomoea nil TaxID=35883 RepID=UPI000901719B|nr:PREDICTED: uncharacterized protein LOC109155581 [Ipomoea nil]XP_019158728.1 PREDICTED: uncharacterized protein LOC109155581 [Ipomoea nil]
MEPLAEEYSAFEERVKRTVYIDNLSPLVNESILRSAFGQFGNVLSVQFIPNYLEPRITSQAALIEVDNPKQAKGIISDITNSPFMVSGMPRPVRALPAEPEMFDDRPRKPGRKIECRWVDPGDPDFEVAQELVHLTRKHAAEVAFLLEREAEEEKKLANQQAEALKSNYKKFELIDNAVADKTALRLGARYNIRVSDA